MSFWDNVKKFAQPYADDDYDDYEEDDYMDEYDEEPAAPVSRRASSRRSAAPAPIEEEEEDESFGSFSVSNVPAAPAASAVSNASGFNGRVVSMNNGPKQEVVLFRPLSFNDTSKAADSLRNRKAVVLNLENVDKEMSRRVVDFLSGTVYALDGSVKKIAKSAYLFCPHHMDVVGDLEALQAEVESYV